MGGVVERSDAVQKQPIDGTATIEISEDKMSAYLIITAPENDGEAVTVDDVRAEILESPVRAEIEYEAVEQTVKEKLYGERVIIARGIRPINGIDGVITYRYETGGQLTPKKNERDEMDYKDLGMVQNILAGTLIAVITTESAGEEGVDVFGTPLRPLPGKPAKYLVGLGTVTASNDEGTTIVAAVDGNLTWHKDHFTVEEVLVIGEDVGAATGNIDFIGAVTIKGNVFEGFTVKSKKDVSILGTVSNAVIESGGNIDVKIGCVNSTLKAKGDIKTGFCESCNLESGGDMISGSFISCEMLCRGTINATTGKGVVIGGKVTAVKGMVFNSLGSPAYTKTSLALGEGAILSKEKRELEIEAAAINEKITQFVHLADTLGAAKKTAGSLTREREEMLSTAIRGRFQMSTEAKKIKKKIEEIESRFQDNSSLYVEVRKTLYPGVSVRIGEIRFKIDKEWDRCHIRLDNAGEIEIAPITGR